MRKYLTFLLTCLALNSLSAQNQDHEIDTKEENSDWLNEFKNQNLGDKIEFLKTRFKEDQDIFLTQINPHGEPAIKEGFEKFTYYRPIYIFKAGKKDPIILPGNPSEKLIADLQNILNTGNVESIDLIEDQVSKTIYGARGSFGIIEIQLKNLETYSDLKKFIHNPA